jgi:hypothetical protein
MWVLPPPKLVSTGKRVGRGDVLRTVFGFPVHGLFTFFFFEPLVYCVCIQYCMYVHTLYLCGVRASDTRSTDFRWQCFPAELSRLVEYMFLCSRVQMGK